MTDVGYFDSQTFRELFKKLPASRLSRIKTNTGSKSLRFSEVLHRFIKMIKIDRRLTQLI